SLTPLPNLRRRTARLPSISARAPRRIAVYRDWAAPVPPVHRIAQRSHCRVAPPQLPSPSAPAAKPSVSRSAVRAVEQSLAEKRAARERRFAGASVSDRELVDLVATWARATSAPCQSTVPLRQADNQTPREIARRLTHCEKDPAGCARARTADGRECPAADTDRCSVW